MKWYDYLTSTDTSEQTTTTTQTNWGLIVGIAIVVFAVVYLISKK